MQSILSSDPKKTMDDFIATCRNTNTYRRMTEYVATMDLDPVLIYKIRKFLLFTNKYIKTLVIWASKSKNFVKPVYP